MRRFNRVGSILVGLGVIVVALLASSSTSADGKVYVAPGLGISGATVESDGQFSLTPVSTSSGSDADSSPLIALAVGLQIPMDELVPREWLLDVRLPDLARAG